MNLWTTLLLALSLTFVNASAWASGAHGVFRVVKGQIKVKSAQSGQVSRARIGSKVLPGDIIMAAKNSRAKVVMVDNNEINISPDTQIKIEKYEYDPGQNKKDVLLNVIYGKVRSKVEQKYDGRTSKFQVKTPSAVAGVRGTNFLTSYDQNTGNSQVVTFEGKVEFGTPGPGGQITGSVQVTPGNMATISKGGAPPVSQPVPQSEMKKMDKETDAETATGEGPSTEGGDQNASKDGKGKESGDGKDKKDGNARSEDGGRGDKKSADSKDSKNNGRSGEKAEGGDKGKGNSQAGNGGDKKDNSGRAEDGGGKKGPTNAGNNGDNKGNGGPKEGNQASNGDKGNGGPRGGNGQSGGPNRAGPDGGGKGGPAGNAGPNGGEKTAGGPGGAPGSQQGGPNGAAGPGGPGGGPDGGGERGPASAGPMNPGPGGPVGPGGPGPMIGDSDLAGGPGNTDFGPGSQPLMPEIPVLAPPIDPGLTDTVRDTIQSGDARLKIIINQQ